MSPGKPLRPNPLVSNGNPQNHSIPHKKPPTHIYGLRDLVGKRQRVMAMIFKKELQRLYEKQVAQQQKNNNNEKLLAILREAQRNRMQAPPQQMTWKVEPLRIEHGDVYGRDRVGQALHFGKQLYPSAYHRVIDNGPAVSPEEAKRFEDQVEAALKEKKQKQGQKRKQKQKQKQKQRQKGRSQQKSRRPVKRAEANVYVTSTHPGLPRAQIKIKSLRPTAVEPKIGRMMDEHKKLYARDEDVAQTSTIAEDSDSEDEFFDADDGGYPLIDLSPMEDTSSIVESISMYVSNICK